MLRCLVTQDSARVTFSCREQEGYENANNGEGLRSLAVAVACATSASDFVRYTPPPPLQTNAKEVQIPCLRMLSIASKDGMRMSGV